MKRTVCICALVLLCVFSAAAKDKHQTFNQLCKVAKQVDKIEGVESFKIGGLLMTAFKAMAKAEMKSEDDDDSALSAEALKNLSAMLMVDFSEASERNRTDIANRFSAVLEEDADLIMEAYDEGEQVRMYGKVDEEKGIVEDMVIFCSDGSLMAFCGKLAFSEAMSIAND